MIDDGRPVVGVTSFNNFLFVLRSPSRQQIEVYDRTTFRKLGKLTVKELSNCTKNCGLTSCATYSCVYVSDFSKNKFHKVHVDLSRNNKVYGWYVYEGPSGLSINSVCHLLVSCYVNNRIQEYTTNGSCVREIRLSSYYINDNLSPLHALQVSQDHFVVSCMNVTKNTYDVVEVKGGGVAVRYAKQLQSTTHKTFCNPRHLSLDKDSERILVADSVNHRIVILKRSWIGAARELNVESVRGGLHEPSCLHFDVSHNRLFVGESDCGEQNRVLVFENVF